MPHLTWTGALICGGVKLVLLDPNLSPKYGQ